MGVSERGESGEVGGGWWGGGRGRRAREEIGEERTWTTTRRPKPLGRRNERREEKMENGGRGIGKDESVEDVFVNMYERVCVHSEIENISRKVRV